MYIYAVNKQQKRFKMENAQNNIVKFEVGKSYYYRFACNYDTVVTVTVVKRTAKTITIIDDGEKLTRKIYILDGAEHVAIAHYSMAPTLDATRTQEALEASQKAAEERKAEAERKAKEEKEHTARLAAINEAKVKTQNTIARAVKMYPVTEGAPVVEVPFSEFVGLYEIIDKKQNTWSVKAADMILGELDMWQHEKRGTSDAYGWYEKTDFTIRYTDDNGEESTYQGRYDLGDGEGGLLNHIRNFGEWHRTHEEFGAEKKNPDETNEILEFVKMLEKAA